jgi:hypothetical protein
MITGPERRRRWTDEQKRAIVAESCGQRSGASRRWPPPEQRAVFQPSGVSAAWLGGIKMIGADTLWLFLLGLPALALGTWAGLKLFGKLDEGTFCRVVLVLLLISGLSLLVLAR